MNVLLPFGLLLLVAYVAHRSAVRLLRVEGVGFLSRHFRPGAERSSRRRRLLACAAGPFATYLLLIALCAIALSTGRRFAAVLRPLPGSPAEVAGIRAGDRVISAGGAPVESFEDLRVQVEKAGGSTLSITVLRGAREVELEISPDARGHVGVMANGERLPLKLSSLARSVWFPIYLVVLQVEALGRMALGSGPTAVLIQPFQVGQASPLGKALGWWMMLAAESASLAWLPVLLLTAGCAWMAERRLAVAPSLGEGA